MTRTRFLQPTRLDVVLIPGCSCHQVALALSTVNVPPPTQVFESLNPRWSLQYMSYATPFVAVAITEENHLLSISKFQAVR